MLPLLALAYVESDEPLLESFIFLLQLNLVDHLTSLNTS